jgi:hypothetical protein
MSGGGIRGVTPPKIEILFFFSESFYLVETKVAGMENVWESG